MARECTAKQEAFAVGIAQGLSQADAYRAAFGAKPGQKPAYFANQASRLAKLPHVAARINELKKRVRVKVKKLLAEDAPPATAADLAVEPVLKTTAVELAPVLFENARIGFSDIRRLLADDGTLKPPAEWDADTAAAVSSIKVRELFGEGKDGKGLIGHTVEVKLWDKGGALDRLGKHLGMYEKDNAQKNANIFAGLPREQVKAIVEALSRDRRPVLG